MINNQFIGEEYYNKVVGDEIDNKGQKKSVLMIFNNRD